MSKPKHQDLYTGKNYTDLPEALQKAIRAVSSEALSNANRFQLASECRKMTHALPAESAGNISYDIRMITRWFTFHGYETRERSPFLKYFGHLRSGRNRIVELVKTNADFAWLSLHHGDGHIREMALRSLDTAPISAFEISVIILRLNDWVEDVRHAALRYAKKYIADTPNPELAKAARFILPRMPQLGRIDDDARDFIESLFRSEAVGLEILKILRSSHERGLASFLNRLLAEPTLDDHLLDLSQNAAEPIIHAVSLKALLFQRAQIFAGYRQQWIDKSMGLSQRKALYLERKVTVQIDIMALMEIGTNDSSSVVRRNVADALIRYIKNPNPKFDAIADQLATDKSAAVRRRIDYYVSNRDIAKT